MNKPNFALKLASVLFMIICVFHALRLAFNIEVSVARHPISLWLSALGVVVSFGLSIWFGWLACHSDRHADSSGSPPAVGL